MIVLFLLLLMPTEDQSLIDNASYTTLTISCNPEVNSPPLWDIIVLSTMRYVLIPKMDDFLIIQIWMILVHLSLCRTKTNNNHLILDDSSLDGVNCHPILDDSSHPLLDDVSYPILDDSSHPDLDGINCHPILDDSSHPLLDHTSYHPILDNSSHPLFVASFPGLSRLQFLIAYSMQKRRGKAWEKESRA